MGQATTSANRFEAGEQITPAMIAGLAEEAVERLDGFVHETPLLSSEALSSGEAQIFVKDETQQPGGSFKDRGAGNAVLYHADEGEQMVVTASAGNHGKGVARAAKERGMDATVVVPNTASQEKKKGIEKLLGEVLVHGSNFNEALDYSLRLAESLSGSAHVHPYADRLVMAGQASLGLELLRQTPDMTHLVLPVGGGGMLAGVGSVIKHHRKDVEVIAAQVTGNSAFVDSLEVGKPLQGRPIISHFEGIAVGNVHPITFDLARQVVDRTVVVDPELVDQTMYDYRKEHDTLLERAGAVSPAAARHLALTAFAGEEVKIVAVASGANPPQVLSKWLSARARRRGWDMAA